MEPRHTAIAKTLHSREAYFKAMSVRKRGLLVASALPVCIFWCRLLYAAPSFLVCSFLIITSESKELSIMEKRAAL